MSTDRWTYEISHRVDSDSAGCAAKIASMNRKLTSPALTTLLSSRVLIVLSLAYGIVIAILGAIGSSALGIVALIGALIVGGLWVVRAVVSEDAD